MSPSEMDHHASVYLCNYLRQGGCVVSPISFFVWLFSSQTLINRIEFGKKVAGDLLFVGLARDCKRMTLCL